MRVDFFFFFFIYDRNSNLNSHTCIFWRSRGLNPCPHRGVELFGREITTKSNAQVAKHEGGLMFGCGGILHEEGF
jgi:hypothetical protein